MKKSMNTIDKNIKYIDFNIVFSDDTFITIHQLDKLFEIIWDNKEFANLIKKYYAKLDYQKRKEYKNKWQLEYDRRKRDLE